MFCDLVGSTALSHELDPEEEAGAAHVPDQRVPLRKPPKPLEEAAADPQGPLLQPFLLDDVEIRRGTTNYVPNPGFEGGTSSWVMEGTLVHSRRITTEAHSGNAKASKTYFDWACL